MINYSALEDDIVTRLAPMVTAGLEVEALPDRPANYSTPFKKPRITVAYRSSEFAKEVTRGRPGMWATDAVVQEEFASVEIVIQARTIRGAAGIYSIKADVDFLLLGFRPTDWSKMLLESFKFVDHDKEAGVFTYAYTWITSCMKVQHPDPENIVLLTQVTFETDVE